MTTPHTPGPWSVFEPKSPFVCYEGGDSPATIVSSGVHIATMPGVRTLGLSETARANARLIASAPQMLFALELGVALVSNIEENDILTEYEREFLDYARTIVSKAKGIQ